ncbi:MAG: serine/threonine protein kinase [Planctomycetaceae bacterium]
MKFTFAPESTPLDGYTIKRAIHRGGFGEVYYALSDAGKEVALKLLNNNLEVELRGVSQCLNLKHPNLVTIFDMKTDGDGDHWIIMEYVSGDCLDKVVARHPDGMPMEMVLKWLSGMTAGISFLHDRGIVHRDLKPANVFSDASGVKIGDVGLSKFISESRRSAQTQSVGTVYYMAPEVARGRYGKEVDVYALGVMLYELVTGRVPFNGQTTAEILMKHLSERPDLTPLPERLRPVLARALDKDPERRISDAKQLELEFRNAVKGVGPAIPPPPPSGYTRPRPEQFAQATPRAASSQQRDFGETVVPGRHQPTPVPQPRNDGPVAWFKGLNPLPKCLVGGILLVFALQLLGGRMPGPFISGPIIVGGFLGLMAYCGYSVWTAIFGREAANPAPAAYAPPPAGPAAQRHAAQYAKLKPAKKCEPVFRRAKSSKSKPLSPATRRDLGIGQRLTELTGSMTVAAFCTAAITSILGAVEAFDTASQAAVFGLVTLVASWAIMSISKLTEGTGLFSLARRTLTGVTGVGVGLFAYTLNEVLLSDLPIGEQGSPLFDRHEMVDYGQPTAVLFVAFFGALMFARRWWWHTDSFRSGRFRISTALVTVMVSLLVCGITGFHLFWGLTWALAISAIVQLSSVWTPTEKRHIAAAKQTGLEA